MKIKLLFIIVLICLLNFIPVSAAEIQETVNNNNPDITFIGNWGYTASISSNGYKDYVEDDFSYTADIGSAIEYTFFGSGIEYWAGKFPDKGRVEVYIDDIPVETVDCYNASSARTSVMLYSKTGLEHDYHTIKLVVIEKNPKSSGTWVELDAFVVTKDPDINPKATEKTSVTPILVPTSTETPDSQNTPDQDINLFGFSPVQTGFMLAGAGAIAVLIKFLIKR